MHSERLTINSFDEPQVFVRPGWQTPGHHLYGEDRALWFYSIDELTAVFNGCIEELRAHVPRLRSIPDIGMIRAGDIDAVPGAKLFGKRKTISNPRKVPAAFFGIWIEDVAECSHLRNDNVLLGELAGPGRNAIPVIHIHLPGS